MPVGTRVGPRDTTNAMAQRLSPEDSRILALESKSVVGHTCKVVIAERTGDGVEYLRDRIARRIALAPGCRRRIVVTPYRLDAPVWADDPDFDVRRHVRAVPVPGPVGDGQLREIVARLMAQRLPRDRPLWAIDVVEPLDDGTRAVIWRIHHAMADGQAAMAIGSALLWSDSTDPEPDPPPLPAAEPLPTSNMLIAAALSDRANKVGDTAHRIGRRVRSRRRMRESLEELRGAPGAIRRELVPERETSPLNAPAGRRRQVAFVGHPLDALGELKEFGDRVAVRAHADRDPSGERDRAHPECVVRCDLRERVDLPDLPSREVVRAGRTAHVRNGEGEDVRVRRDAVRQVERVLRHLPDVREDRVELFGVVILLPGPHLLVDRQHAPGGVRFLNGKVDVDERVPVRDRTGRLSLSMHAHRHLNT